MRNLAEQTSKVPSMRSALQSRQMRARVTFSRADLLSVKQGSPVISHTFDRGKGDSRICLKSAASLDGNSQLAQRLSE